MDSFVQDLRYGFRTILRNPGFTFVAVLALGLGIGANSAIFSVVNAVILRPLPYAEPGRLVMVFEDMPKFGVTKFPFSAPDYQEFTQQSQALEEIAAFQNKSFELSGVNEPERIVGLRATAGLFPLLGVQPAVGRPFTREEERQGATLSVLSYGLWQRKFSRESGIIGKSITLDRRSYTVIGILPRGFAFPNHGPAYNHDPAEVFVPMSFIAVELQSFGMMYNNSVMARLKPGITAVQAESEAKTIIKRFAEQYPAVIRSLPNFELTASVTPYRDEIVGQTRTLLFVLLGAVGMVLLIGCADVTNLMLTRAVARRREMAVRQALGAGRFRLVRQVLTEALVLSIFGGLLGLALARWGTDLLVALAPVSIPRAQEIGIDGSVLAFTLLLCVATAILSGLVPALETSGTEITETLKEGGRGGSGARRRRRVFAVLVTAQFALALVLLVGAALLVRSFVRLLGTDPGFRSENVLSMTLSLPGSTYTRATEIRS